MSSLDEDIEQTRQDKQAYLYTHVIEACYDAEAFQSYILSLREEGDNIDNWSLEELKTIVANFQAKFPKIEVQAPQPSIVENEEIKDNFEKKPSFNEVVSPVQLPKSSDPLISKILNDETYYGETYKKRTIRLKKRREFNNLGMCPSLDITVCEPQIKSGGIFTSSYVSYKIVTKSTEENSSFKTSFLVFRRYSDFNWLSTTLKRDYPGYFVAPMHRKTKKRNFDNAYLIKRMAFLEKFLNGVSRCLELRNSPHFQLFLSCSNETEFQNKKKLLDKNMTKFSSLNESFSKKIFASEATCPKIEELINTMGEIELSITGHENNIYQNMTELVNLRENLFKKLRKLIAALVMNFHDTTNTLFTIGDCFAQLFTSSQKFNAAAGEDKNVILSDFYATVNNAVVQWGNNISSQIKVIQEHFVQSFKYAYHEQNALKESLKVRAHACSEYTKERTALDLRKEKLFQSGDISKWELANHDVDKTELLKNKDLAFRVMLPKETAILKNMRDVYAYLNALMTSESRRMLEDQCHREVKNLISFCNKESALQTDLHMQWADITTHLKELEQAEFNVGKEQAKMPRQSVIMTSNNPFNETPVQKTNESSSNLIKKNTNWQSNNIKKVFSNQQ